MFLETKAFFRNIYMFILSVLSANLSIFSYIAKIRSFENVSQQKCYTIVMSWWMQ